MPYFPLCIQGLWQREHSRPGEAHHRLLHGGKQTLHRGSLLQVTTRLQCWSSQENFLPWGCGANVFSCPRFQLHTCRTLAACSKDGADPYVSFVLLPDKKATTKRRTATKKRDLNPEFNERWAEAEKQSRHKGKSAFFTSIFSFAITHRRLPPQVRLWFHPGGVDPEEAGPVGEEQRVLHEQREGAHREGKRSTTSWLLTMVMWRY